MHFGNEGVQCFRHIGTIFVLELKLIAMLSLHLKKLSDSFKWCTHNSLNHSKWARNEKHIEFMIIENCDHVKLTYIGQMLMKEIPIIVIKDDVKRNQKILRKKLGKVCSMEHVFYHLKNCYFCEIKNWNFFIRSWCFTKDSHFWNFYEIWVWIFWCKTQKGPNKGFCDHTFLIPMYWFIQL